MKVSDLITQLQALDPNLPVMVHGYEFGLEDLTSVEVTQVTRNYHGENPDWGGPHERTEDAYSDETKGEQVQAAILPRGSR